MWLVYLAFVIFSTIIGSGNSEEAKVRLLSFETCEIEGQLEPFGVFVETRKSEEDEAYLVASKVELNIKGEVTQGYTFSMHIEKWVDGKWDHQSDVSGKLWEFVDQYLSRLWEKVAAMADPKFPEQPPLPPDTYYLENFEVLQEEMDLPAMLYGRFKLTTRINSELGEVVCLSSEVETEKKE